MSSTWFQCPKCLILLSDNIRFLCHLENHTKLECNNGFEQFHSPSGHVQLTDDRAEGTLFIPKIHLISFITIWQKYSFLIPQSTVLASPLTEAQMEFLSHSTNSVVPPRHPCWTTGRGFPITLGVTDATESVVDDLAQRIRQKNQAQRETFTSLAVDVNGKIKIEVLEEINNDLEMELSTNASSRMEFLYHCPFCVTWIGYRQKVPFRRHMRKLHQSELGQRNEGGVSTPSCTSCGSVCSSSLEFEHYKTTTDKRRAKRGFICTRCGNGFPTQEKLDEHVRDLHSRVSGIYHECPNCHRKYPTLENLKSHQYVYCNLKRLNMNFLCQHCEKSFRNTKLLTQHLEIHSEVRHVCKLCCATLSMKSSLRRHMREMHRNDKRRRPKKGKLVGKTRRQHKRKATKEIC